MGFQSQSAKKKIRQYCTKRRERTIQKNAEEIISTNIPEEGFTVVVEDKSIFVHDALVRRKMWTAEGMRPVVTMTGSHQRTYLFGALCIDGRQLFRQYDTFDHCTFLDYLKELQNKFHKVILFLDRAPQHYRSIIVRKYFDENKDLLRVNWFPKGSPEFNVVEECWKQGKDDLLVSKYYPRFPNLRNAIAKYYRTKRFHLDITKFLLRNVS
jgi:transposase